MTLATWAGAAMFLTSLLHFLWRYFFTFGEAVPGNVHAATIATDLAVNMVLFGVFALHHSLLARTRAKAWIHTFAGADAERTLYVWAASLLFLGVAAWWQPVAGIAWRLEGGAAWLAWTGQAAGVAFTAWSAATLGIWELAGITQPVGSPRVRTDGPYAFVRHPIYFAWLLLVWSVPFMNGTRLSFAAISTFYLALAVPFEECSLVRLFGPDYEHYQQRVRWRMLPFVY